MPYKISLAGASVQGRDHSIVHKNNQDSYMFGSLDYAHWGVVCDGCGEGRRSEMGAHLSAMAISEYLRISLISYGESLSSEEASFRLELMVEAALMRLVYVQSQLLNTITLAAPVQRQLALEHLLSTVVGFVILDDQLCVFHAGDGSYCIDDTTVEIDAGNQPRYAIYHALSTGRSEFDYQTFPPPHEKKIISLRDVNRFAVSTDGFQVGLYSEAFEHSKSSNALKRWLNIQQQKEHRFSDDTTIITGTVTREG